MTWTIQRKLACGFGIAILILISCTLIAWKGINDANKTAEDVQRSYATVVDLTHFISLVREVTAEQRAFLISGDESSVAGIPAVRKDLDETLTSLTKRLQGTPGTDTITQIRAVMLQRRDFVNAMLKARKEESFDAARTLFATGKDDQLLKQLLDLAGDLKQQQLQRLADDRARQEADRAQIISVLVGACLLAVVVVVIISTFITRAIRQNIKISVELLEAMSHKDLSIPDGVPSSNDEVAQSIYAINSLKGSMQDVIGAMSNAATEVAGAGNDISQTSEEIAQSVQLQRSEVEQIASALHEMTITVQDVASNSHDAAQAAEQAVTAAQSGGEVVLGTVATMQKIAETVGRAAQDITKLGKETENIGSVVNLIEDIATQTNLLALNATIEAARAGEQGKGFAVVASEVRRLAERTAEFTKQIAEKITSVQRDAETAVKSMRQGKEDVDLGVSNASEAKESLSDIMKAIEAAKERIAMIATATAEQSAATGELSMNVERISQQVVTTAEGAEHNARACAELSSLADTLQTIVQEFQISGKGGSSNRKPSFSAQKNHTRALSSPSSVFGD